MTGNPNILVVDDEPGLRDMVAEYLTGQGFAVATAEGGAAMRQSELLAQIKCVLRRMNATEPQETATPSSPPAGIPFGRCFLNLEAHQLLDQKGQEIPITSMEFDLLKAFATHPNQVLSRDQLLNLAHHRDQEPLDRGRFPQAANHQDRARSGLSVCAERRRLMCVVA